MKVKKSLIILVFALMMTTFAVQAAGPTGAIFTTTPDGTVVNENVRYNDKIEVYLDGGPGPNAPKTAAGLDDGLYVFQVTDPSGKALLSQDPSKCRVVEVEDGVISRLVPPSELGYNNTYGNGAGKPCHVQDEPDGIAGPSGQHDTNIDADYGSDGAIVVQLMPFADTPNPGGVYKAWITPLQKYLDKNGQLDAKLTKLTGRDSCPGCSVPDPGFSHPDIKTDNFKVKGKIIPPEITVKKFHDKNFDGIFNGDDEWVTGWMVDVTEPGFVVPNKTVFTPATIVAAVPGNYTFLEETPAGTFQTASYVDGFATVPFPDNPVIVPVVGTSGETHEVVFGNVGLGEVKACKVYDLNGNGEVDAGEPYIPGWKMVLTGTLANSDLFGPVTQFTGEDGCTLFDDLLPGDYTVEEILPDSDNYFASSDTTYDFTVVSVLNGAVMSGGSFEVTFTNYCVDYADFGTKGFWHNKNGMNILAGDPDFDDLLAYINSLAPYSSPSSYFDMGEEPFDAFYAGGHAISSLDYGGALNEISQFLVDANADGDPREQLAQQLLAFIFNANYYLGGFDVGFEWNGSLYTAEGLIQAAVMAWEFGSPVDQNYYKDILDGLNNSDAVPFVSQEVCEFYYID